MFDDSDGNVHYEVLVHNQKVNPLHYIIQEFRRF